MKTNKVDGTTTAKSPLASPVTRTQATPTTSFADMLASKAPATPVATDAESAAAEQAKLAEAKKQMGTVLMRGILAAPKMKQLEKVQTEDGLNDD